MIETMFSKGDMAMVEFKDGTTAKVEVICVWLKYGTAQYDVKPIDRRTQFTVTAEDLEIFKESSND